MFKQLLAMSFAAGVICQAQAAEDKVENILVKASRIGISDIANASSVTQFDQDTLRDRGNVNIGDILRSVPGFAVSRSGVAGSLTQVRVRGNEGNQVLVFIDGVKANDPATGAEFDLAHLLNADLASIEVIRGPQSALWGSAASAGVINITTRRAERGQNFSFSAEGGTEDWQNLNISAGHRGDKLDVRFSASDVRTSGFNISRAGSEDDGYENATQNLNIGYEFTEQVRLRANIRQTNATNQFDDAGFGPPVDADSETDLEQLYARIALDIDTLGGRLKHRISANLTDTSNDTVEEDFFSVTGFDTSSSDADVITLTYQATFEISEGHAITGAIERQQEDFSQRGTVLDFSGLILDPNRDEEIDYTGFVIEYNGALTEDVFLQASLRRDNNSDFDDITTGRISVAWQSNDLTKLRAAFGTGQTNPTFTERFGFFTNFIGNPDLEPERSRGWEFGIDRSLPDANVTLSATWFNETLDDEIDGFAFDPVAGGFTAINDAGESDRQGLELAVFWQATDSLDLDLTYTWLDAEEDHGSDEIRRARNVASANARWRLLDDQLSVNLNVAYNGEQDDLDFSTFPSTPVELDAFTLVTLSANYQINERFEVYGRVENALDDDYEEVFGFVTPERSAVLGVRFSL